MSAGGVQHLYSEEIYRINSKAVVVLDKEWPSVSEEEKALLNKILGSVKLSLTTVHIISRSSLSLKSLQFLSPSKVLVFGAEMQEDLKPYENITIHGTAVIKADPLAQLDDARKKSLWLALKQMFGV